MSEDGIYISSYVNTPVLLSNLVSVWTGPVTGERMMCLYIMGC